MNYPSGTKPNCIHPVTYSNRGMTLECDINWANEYYLLHDIAIIYKKPVPVTINKVHYPSRKDAVIIEAHFKIPSTTDYNGIYKGRYIDFEAKETKKDYFPLANIHKHQLDHLRKIVKHGGVGFIIVSFTAQNRIFLLNSKELFEFLDNNQRKSIPLSYFVDNGYELFYQYQPRIDYIKIIDNIILKESKYEEIFEK